MAFKRTTTRRSRTFRRFRKPFRRGKFARQKFDKVVLYNNLNQELTQTLVSSDPVETGGCGANVIVGCSQASNACGPEDNQSHCCVNTATFTLFKNMPTLSQNQLGPSFPEVGQSLRGFEGNVTLVRIYGDIWARTLIGFPAGTQRCVAQQLFTEQYARRYGETWWWGLKKLRLTDTPFVATDGDDTSAQDFTNAWFGYDWTESHLLWQRRKFWAPVATRYEELMPLGAITGVCSDVTGGGGGGGQLVNTLASGSGTINTRIDISPNTTTCSERTLTGETCIKQADGILVREPPWHHWRVNIKKHITMRSDERLDLQLGTRKPAMPGNDTGWGCDTPQWPGENHNTMVFMRLAAVIRLN